jgi:hypothetical protein
MKLVREAKYEEGREILSVLSSRFRAHQFCFLCLGHAFSCYIIPSFFTTKNEMGRVENYLDFGGVMLWMLDDVWSQQFPSIANSYHPMPKLSSSI